MVVLYLVGIWIEDLLEVPVGILAYMVFLVCLTGIYLLIQYLVD